MSGSEISSDVLAAADRLGRRARVRVLSRTAGDAVREGAASRYGRAGRRFPLWDGESSDPSLRADEAWRELGGFLGDRGCLVFWDPDHERDVLQFDRATDLLAVLDDMYRTEFYVTDEAWSFLACFNHHDYLIVWGAAVPWLRSLVQG
jgi:hypothetical protein